MHSYEYKTQQQAIVLIFLITQKMFYQSRGVVFIVCNDPLT